MSTYAIGEIAERSGFPASTLRYYEDIGLVEPVSRTSSGYRIYDDSALDRLAFIGRAKQLGCSLDEITDLVALWDGQRCGPVQRRFHELVTAKIAGAQDQIVALVSLTADLQSAATQLAGPAVDGPCEAGCACLAAAGPVAVAAPARLVPAPAGQEPIACSLESEAVADRVADWQSVLGHVTARHRLDSGALRLEFDDALRLDDLARLAAAEQECCRFFGFAITVDHRGSALEVTAPEGAADVVTAMFGAPGAPEPATTAG